MGNRVEIMVNDFERTLKIIEYLFNHFNLQSIESLVNQITQLLQNNSNDINTLLAIYFAIDSKYTQYGFKHYIAIATDIIKNYENYIDILDINLNIYHIQKINISNLIDSKKIIDILHKLNIYDIRNFNKLSLESVIAIISPNIKKIVAYFKVVRVEDYLNKYKEIINNCFETDETNQRNVSILLDKFDTFDKDMTLDEIGIKYSLTKERVRQIIIKQLDIMKSKYLNVKEDINLFTYYLFSINKKYITKEEVDLRLGDVILTNKLALLCNEFGDEICYDKKYGVFYIKNNIAIDELISLLVKDIGEGISTKRFNTLNSFKQRLVLNEYRITGYDNDLYILNDSSYIELILEMIDDKFPKGIRPGKIEDFDLLDELFYKKYDRHINMTQHALSANLVRYNYYNVDRGTFKKDVVPTLSDGLIIEIKNYIRLSGRTYYYTLFDEFKYELEILGINNRYMLKSVIDPQLEDEFICNRDFVDKSNHSKTDKSQINSYSKINKIINLNTKKDINSNLSKDISESPIKVVNNYNKITIEKIKKRFIENGKKYKLDYVVETIAELTTFNFKDFDRYAKIYGINSFISYLEFQVYMSNSFMQIDMDKCTNKSNLKLYKNVLKEFKDKIDYFIDKYGFIDTRTFNEYNEIPGLKQECNKYILVGIIRSYLNRHFTIEYTDSLYNMTDYIIYNNSNISIEVAETPVIIQNDYNKIIKENVKERFIVNDKKYKFNCIVETTNKLSAFNYKVFERYAKKYGIRDFISYLEFQVLMSDTFMQIDKDECISKNSLNLDRYQLNILKDNIDNFLDKYELIDTRTFNEYEELPGFKGKCNKYILVGIIRSYLSRYYKIEYTDSAYDKTDYIIKN